MARWVLAVVLLWSASAFGAPQVATRSPSGPGAEEIACLALNIYWEGRAAPLEDRWAIAHVTLNRVASPDFPDTVCEVVKQGGELPLGRCQFSWWCDGRSDTPFEKEAWREAQRLAAKALIAPLPDPTGGALFFHNESVAPAWADELVQLRRIGSHIYYR